MQNLFLIFSVLLGGTVFSVELITEITLSQGQVISHSYDSESDGAFVIRNDSSYDWFDSDGTLIRNIIMPPIPEDGWITSYYVSSNILFLIVNSGGSLPSNSDGYIYQINASEDMVNWNSANPGTYGASTNERFFRIRAVQETD